MELGTLRARPVTQTHLFDGTFPAGDPIFKTPNWGTCSGAGVCPYGTVGWQVTNWGSGCKPGGWGRLCPRQGPCCVVTGGDGGPETPVQTQAGLGRLCDPGQAAWPPGPQFPPV